MPLNFKAIVQKKVSFLLEGIECLYSLKTSAHQTKRRSKTIIEHNKKTLSRIEELLFNIPLDKIAEDILNDLCDALNGNSDVTEHIYRISESLYYIYKNFKEVRDSFNDLNSIIERK